MVKMTQLVVSLMTSSLVAIVAFYAVLASAAGLAWADATPRDPGGLEFAAQPGGRDDLRLDVSLEPVIPETGAGAATAPAAVARPEPEAWADADPWAEAVVEAR